MAAIAILDDRATVERLDPQGLLGRIESLPEQCEEAWRAVAGLELPPAYRETANVVVAGMGGSAFAAGVLQSLVERAGTRPVAVARSYELPAYVDRSTLVVACSHSGNTEETLAMFEAAQAAGGRCVAVTTGGRLAALARERGVPLVRYAYDGEPRSAVGHQLMALLAIAGRAGVLPGQAAEVDAAIATLRAQRERLGFAVPSDANDAKQIARRLHGRLTVIVGAGALAQASRRWRTQINENSESWAIADELPEAGHNTVVGLALPREAVALLYAVLLWHPSLAPLARHYEALEVELDRAGVAHERFEVEGDGLLAPALASCHAGDFVSYYLALLNGVEPAPMAAIDRLKARLAQP